MLTCRMLQNMFQSKIRETEKEYAARIELLSFLGYSQYVSKLAVTQLC